jgi:hypothetical protein
MSRNKGSGVRLLGSISALLLADFITLGKLIKFITIKKMEIIAPPTVVMHENCLSRKCLINGSYSDYI